MQNTGNTTSTRISSGNTGHQVGSSSSREKLLESRTPSVTLEHQQLYGRDRDPEAFERERDVERLGHGRIRRDSRGTTLDVPLPSLPRTASDLQGLRRVRTMDTHASGRQRSGLDWIIPVDEKSVMRSRTVAARLQPTIEIAQQNRDKYAKKAKYTGWILNLAIGLQVLLGSLTTGLSAISTTGRGFAIQTTILGGLTTMIAGYLARTRGSNEPELSITRVKDLDKYIRETTAFILDHGDSDDPMHDDRIRSFRMEFEELLGNGNG
ncbi:hypothetical protein EST38_g6263 [Candolleomyces aberdarensis]|uniref:SMODS and SLOG-associating 2TM effector domain-containing protein n=1 Tax=Candolleomyces aberdarensis TaxID=2316362 RepID=A0A4Q2DL32_9AGAR|nr:hypothetical protein EST38_g6263 [Candolleomyces aberdarensis]